MKHNRAIDILCAGVWGIASCSCALAGDCDRSCLAPVLKASFESTQSFHDASVGQDPFSGSMDSTMIEAWRVSHEKGETAYGLDVVSERRCGRYGLVLNPKRSVRIPPMESRDISVPFNEDRFNFTRADTAETLFDGLVYAGMECDVVINKFFIKGNHFLFLPERYSKHRQFIFPRAVRAVCEFVSTSRSDDLIMGYNSVGAFASINHLHIQGMFLGFAPPVVNAPVEVAGTGSNGVEVALSRDWPIDFVRFCADNPADLAGALSKTITDIQQMGVPHNVAFARKGGKIMAFVFIRDVQAVTQGVGTAFLECSGVVVMSDSDFFGSVSENGVSNLLGMSRHPLGRQVAAKLLSLIKGTDFLSSSINGDAFISA